MMATLIHILRLLSIVIWVGGIIFFAFVLAPVAFHLLPSTHLAGIVVGGTLRVLDIIGLICGGVFILATIGVLYLPGRVSSTSLRVQIVLAFGMLAATNALHYGILPAMELDRHLAGGDIEASPSTDPAHIHFERLHKRSEQVEGAVLLCGLGIVVLLARESIPATQ